LVIAGAGSGKTRTLTYRVAYLVEHGVPPDAILLLTFTRKASQEMLRRASALLDDRCAGVNGGTFHSFANSMLRRYAARLGFDANFTILDRADSENLLALLCREMAFTGRGRTFPRKQTLANLYSRSVNKSQTVEELVHADYPHLLEYLEGILELGNAYRERKRETNFLDYDDLLLFLRRLLKENADVRQRLSARYRHIMVDEYQDTNRIQSEILYLLAEVNRNLMVVGDDSQSIYAFRGADFRNIMDFPQVYPEARIITLEENYRSVQPILNLTNEIIAQAAVKYSKRLFTRREGGQRPVLIASASENAQSRFITTKIDELNNQGLPLNRMAVLFRAGFHSFDLELELARAGIAYVKVGGFKFAEASHIKDVLAHLRVLANPRDRLSWLRILLLLENIGPKKAQQIYEAIARAPEPRVGIQAAVEKKAWGQALQGLAELFEQIASEATSLAQAGETVVRYYTPLLPKHYDDYPRREGDLEHLVTIMERYRTLEAFLADMALEPPNISSGKSLYRAPSSEQRLVLSTIHSAKGLEWDTVFILWALDGRFPSIHALHSPEELEEELRLMYVAATRARENLFITYPTQIRDRLSGRFLAHPSRFIAGLSEEILLRQEMSNWCSAL
jgi:DNA helicase-2/ATP-dependent DNA helicase PcrA